MTTGIPEIKDTFCLSQSSAMNTDQMVLDPKDVYRRGFQKDPEVGKCLQATSKDHFSCWNQAGLGKMGHFSEKGKQQRDILQLQYKKPALSELALSNCPGSGPYG